MKTSLKTLIASNHPMLRFPGIATTADGSEAVVWVETQISQGACAYPITPSTLMGGAYQVAVANGQRNLWGEPLSFLELESEHSSASTCEGFALAGGRVTNFTSGQGLILMKEVLYVISGKRLPVVFHIGARALTSQSLNIHAGHDDVMGVSDCGWGMLFGRNAQEAADLALIARRAAEESATPFFNVQDGFLTTHTIESLLLPEPDLMKEFIGEPRNLWNLMDPSRPVMSGVVQNQDSYMKGKIAQRTFYDRLPEIIDRVMAGFTELTGRRYGLIDGHRLDDADYALVGMGSMLETAAATADFLRERDGIKLGTLHVSCFRPFPGPQIVAALKHLKAIAVIERLDNPTAQSNPLAAEIKAAFADALSGAPGYPKIDRAPAVYSGSAGLGGRDVRPADFIAVARHIASGAKRRFFVLGIKHDLALLPEGEADVRPDGAFSMRGHSIGGYGSVTTNRIIAAVVGNLSGLRVQAYPLYGSEKKGLPTTYYLTVADQPILVHAEMSAADFVPLNNTDAFRIGDPVAGVRSGGAIFLQHASRDPRQVWAAIPKEAQETIRRKEIRVLALDAVKIAQEVATKPELAQRMQGIVLLGVFLRVAPFLARLKLSEAETSAAVEKALRKFFAKQSEAVIQDNLKAVRRGGEEVFEIPREIIETESNSNGNSN
ncbi:MAG TPA: 2-oxoacid:acceptor oxidoreductase family protein [Verrucomicrobiae bacterium]|jgi:pyruvate-ferredoxin/flavodoxin oxidoreductase|nr:2-oxoacid:acceptor oxidoreductase family protein [Verrucomicrobiae bacterium]